MTEEPGRITRRFLTPPVERGACAPARAHGGAGHGRVRSTRRAICAVCCDRLAASEKRLIIGSHIDTVPDAGAFDGVLGVAVALELAELAKEQSAPYAVEVIAFSEEEGVRFGVPFLGSRAVVERFDASLLSLKDDEGTTLDAAIRNFGLDPARMSEAAAARDVLGFLEVHIEQGPVLEAEDLSVAAVTGIVGQSRLTLEFAGSANHAGTTPMRLRHDALAGCAEWIAAVEKMGQTTDGLVATVGKIAVTPNAGNVIAGNAVVSLDVRHLDDGTRKSAVNGLLEKASAIAERRGLTLQHTQQLDQPAVPMDERLTAFILRRDGSRRIPGKAHAERSRT